MRNVNNEDVFDTNCITPGTEFMVRVNTLLEKYIKNRTAYEPSWRNLSIFYSNHLVPGEGEHKIMHHIRTRRQAASYLPNQRHCLVGQDADLIMLGLATHEPHFTLLRDVVVFGNKKSWKGGKVGDVSSESFMRSEKPLQLLHLSVLREYLEVEFTHGYRGPPLDRERLIDDFIFLTFLVGNDFLPHIPSLDIAESAFDVIFDAYRELLLTSASSAGPRYLVANGTINDLGMLQKLLQSLGRQEEKLMKRRDILLRSKLKSMTDDAGAFVPTPQAESDDKGGVQSLDALLSTDDTLKESDAQFGEKLLLGLCDDTDSSPSSGEPTEEELEPPPSVGEDGHMDQIVIKSTESSLMLIDTGRVGPIYPGITSTGKKIYGPLYGPEHHFSYRDHHYRYKFGVVPSEPSAQPLLKDLAFQYFRGLLWCLSYYTSGCVSWGWYYPYNYGPMLSDVTNIRTFFSQIHFTLGAPFKPFQQLLGCLPPSSSYLLPVPYQWLMTDPLSPLKHIYPTEFVEDLDGKRASWEAVTILPFIDPKEIFAAEELHVPPTALSADEKRRNVLEEKNTLYFLSDHGKVKVIPSKYSTKPSKPFMSRLIPDTYIPFFGFPSLRSLPISGVNRRVLPTDMNRFHRYKSLVLHISASIQLDFPLHKLINRPVYIHYPLMQEGLVIGVGTIASEFRHADYLSLQTTYGAQATRDSFPLEEDPKIVQCVRTEEEVEAWAMTSIKLRKLHLLGGLGMSGLELGKINTRLVVVPVINRLKDTLTGDIQRIYSSVPVDIPLQLARWIHPSVDHRKPIKKTFWSEGKGHRFFSTMPAPSSSLSRGLLQRGLSLVFKGRR
jgi:5'-3' exoribonuclease 1